MTLRDCPCAARMHRGIQTVDDVEPIGDCYAVAVAASWGLCRVLHALYPRCAVYAAVTMNRNVPRL